MMKIVYVLKNCYLIYGDFNCDLEKNMIVLVNE